LSVLDFTFQGACFWSVDRSIGLPGKTFWWP